MEDHLVSVAMAIDMWEFANLIGEYGFLYVVSHYENMVLLFMLLLVFFLLLTCGDRLLFEAISGSLVA